MTTETSSTALPAAGAASSSARLSDDEILGLTTALGATNSSGTASESRTAAEGGAAEGGLAQPGSEASRGELGSKAEQEAGLGGESAESTRSGAAGDEEGSDSQSGLQAAGERRAGEPEALRAVFEAHPELRQAWHAERAYRALFPNLETARELRALFPTVEAARASSTQAAQLAQLDRLFFSGRPEAYEQLASILEGTDPQAFRGLARAVHGRSGAASAGTAGGAAAGAGATTFDPAGSAARDNASDLASRRPPAPARVAEQSIGAGPRDAQNLALTSFYQDANAAAVESVIDLIAGQVDRLLPEEVAPGARQRVVGEIYREVEMGLSANRALAQQLRQALRSGNFDAEHQRAVVNLVTGRARQALPAAAKKVVGEWTSSVLAAQRSKLERQRAAEARVDLTGAGAPGAQARRPLTPTDINYAKMSDADILNL